MGERLAQINPVYPISLPCSAKTHSGPLGQTDHKIRLRHHTIVWKIGKPHLPRMRIARGWVRSRQMRRGETQTCANTPGDGAILRALWMLLWPSGSLEAHGASTLPQDRLVRPSVLLQSLAWEPHPEPWNYACVFSAGSSKGRFHCVGETAFRGDGSQVLQFPPLLI